MRNDGQANFFQRFPQRVKLTVRWVKTLHRGMKLEPANTQLACLTLSFLDSRFTKPRINGPKRQQHVIIARRTDNYEIEEHTSELQSRFDLVCRLLLEKKKQHERALPCCRGRKTHPRTRPTERALHARCPG